MSNVKFNQEAFEIASAKVVAYANSIDKAIAGGFETRQAFAEQCLAGLKDESITLEVIQQRIMDDFILSLPKEEQESATDPESKKCVTSLNHCGPYDTGLGRRVAGTIKQVYHFIKRIDAAGSEAVDKVLAGESYIKAGKTAKPVQEQAKTKTDKGNDSGNETKTLVSLNDAATALTAYIDAAMADTDKAMEIATNPAIASLYEKLTALDSKVQAALVPVAKAA